MGTAKRDESDEKLGTAEPLLVSSGDEWAEKTLPERRTSV